jgi:hypothetical protein
LPWAAVRALVLSFVVRLSTRVVAPLFVVVAVAMLILGVVVPLATLMGVAPITLLTDAADVEETVILPTLALREIPEPAVRLNTPVFEMVTLPVPPAGVMPIPAAAIILLTAPPPPPPEELITPVALLMLRPDPTMKGPETPLT